ncbi:MAG TPA: branched-chain amino acid aminotransferase [Bacteroidales bacterium]|jgi:branched-chain amino acid aminotransferase|nr:branched-chain amino acid aminotransferase [Bacteroidales bacterium]HRT13465.1 branched-chain amino acid aminotransferase [Bacteroidales bacterium]
MKNIDWKNLSFGYVKTDYNVRCYYRNGEWGKIETSSSEHIPMHMAATCLHYGQEAFEGMKAYRGKDGQVRLFRWEENCKRLERSAEAIMMQPVPMEIFRDACFKVIALNKDYIPPYGTGGSLYIRPLLIGTGAKVGVSPADEYLFIIFVTPVGPYFKEGFKPVKMQLARDYDRAAPLGTGHVKVGGNYAASLRAGVRAHKEGYAATIFADAKTKQYIDEAGPANFFGIKDGKYITPDSHTILPSITNMSLRELAKDVGLVVENRNIPIEELATFEEAGACGTAAVISPIEVIHDRETGKVYQISKNGEPGPWSQKLYNYLTGIQFGEVEDKFNWCTVVPC